MAFRGKLKPKSISVHTVNTVWSKILEKKKKEGVSRHSPDVRLEAAKGLAASGRPGVLEIPLS